MRKRVRDARLSVEQILEARLRYADGEQELSKLARDYRVHREVIKRVVLGESHKHLPMPPERPW
jgi:hypothetical protein